LIILFVLVWGIFLYNAISSIRFELKLNSVEVIEVNNQYNKYLGENVSFLTTKRLLTFIQSNNIASEKEGKNESVILSFIDKTGKSAILSTIETFKKLGTKNTYKIYVQNKETSDVNPKNDSNNYSSYYKNGYIRIITIEVNS